MNVSRTLFGIDWKQILMWHLLETFIYFSCQRSAPIEFNINEQLLFINKLKSLDSRCVHVMARTLIVWYNGCVGVYACLCIHLSLIKGKGRYETVVRIANNTSIHIYYVMNYVTCVLIVTAYHLLLYSVHVCSVYCWLGKQHRLG